MRAPVHRNGAVPPLPLARVIEDRDGSRRLHDLTEPAEIRQDGRHATLAQPAVFGTVRAIDVAARRGDGKAGPRGVIWMRSVSLWRGWSVCPALAAAQFILARARGLHGAK